MADLFRKRRPIGPLALPGGCYSRLKTIMKFQHAVFAAFLAAFTLNGQTTEYGPGKGTLVIQGGGPAEGTGIYETFINLAGGPNAKIIIIPTAGGNREKDGKLIVYEEEKVVAPWKKLGLTNVHM